MNSNTSYYQGKGWNVSKGATLEICRTRSLSPFCSSHGDGIKNKVMTRLDDFIKEHMESLTDEEVQVHSKYLTAAKVLDECQNQIGNKEKILSSSIRIRVL